MPSQETKSGIDESLTVFQKALSTMVLGEEAHLVCLQGLSTSDWEASFNVNLLSVALFADYFCKFLADKKIVGSITFISSASAYLGGKAAYASAKAALFGLMNSLHSQYQDIRLNIILPGAFEGGMTADWDIDKKKMVGNQARVGRIARPEEIVQAVNFCIDCKYVAQSTINMTSGRVAVT